MKARIFAACGLLGLIALEAQAQSANMDLDLVGNRFRPLEYAELDEAQRAMVGHILDGPRTAVRGPFNVLLRAPEMGDLAQELGAYVRFKSSLPGSLREMAIIMTAAHWAAEYEWYAHKRAALDEGLDPAIVDAIAAGSRPASMQANEAALYAFCDELLNDHHVSDATFAAATGVFGERAVVEIIGTVGYYSMVSMLLNVDEYPLPDGVAPEFAGAR